MNQPVAAAVAAVLLLGMLAAVSPAEPLGLDADTLARLRAKQGGYSHVNIFSVGASARA
jgi:hypothetical protein